MTRNLLFTLTAWFLAWYWISILAHALANGNQALVEVRNWILGG